VIEEADETGYWLEIACEGGLLDRQAADSLIVEASELVALFTASVTTIKRQRANGHRSPSIQSRIQNPES
jgi:hypothetical protein